MMLILSGIVLILAGVLIAGTKADRRLGERLKRKVLIGKLTGNIGIIFFVLGIACLIAGVADMYF